MAECWCGGNLEIELAHKAQQLLLPKGSPSCSWFCMGVRNQMVTGLGGDFYDFIETPDGCQTIFLGDVTGHGMHAAVVTSLILGFIHHAIRGPACDPEQLVLDINDLLNQFSSRSREIDHLFSATLFCAVIEPKSLEMRYVNAGQTAPLVRRGDEIVELAPTGQPLGYFNEPEITAADFHFKHDDRLLLFTDGITETTNAEGEFFGDGPLHNLLHAGHDHLELLDQLFLQLSEFRGSAPPDDDQTAIVVDFHGIVNGNP